MDKKNWKSPSKESLKDAYNNRGKYPDKNSSRTIFSVIGDGAFWKVTDKAHKVRLLPAHPDDNLNFYGLTVHIHTNVGVNNDQYLCLKRMKSSSCPICEQQAELWDTEPEMAKDLYPQTRYLVWVVDLSLPTDKQEALIWSCPRTAMDDILGVSYKKATDEILNLADIDDGIAIYFDREKTQGTTFSKYKNFQLDDSSTEAKDAWLEGILPFDEVIEYASYEEIKNVFLGLGGEVSSKKDVSPVGETATRSEKASIDAVATRESREKNTTNVETEVVTNTKGTSSIDDMDRDQLEALAVTILSEDFEESEIEEMGSKKLKRLIKEKNVNTTNSQEKESHIEDVSEDPKEALKRKLRERVK